MKAALEGLHGVRLLNLCTEIDYDASEKQPWYAIHCTLAITRKSLAAIIWKDYYLEHKPRIDAKVAKTPSSSKPLSTVKRESSEVAAPRYVSPVVKKEKTRRVSASTTSGRRTVNSITAPKDEHM